MLLHILTGLQPDMMSHHVNKILLSKGNPRTQIFAIKISVKIYLKKQLEFKTLQSASPNPFI